MTEKLILELDQAATANLRGTTGVPVQRVGETDAEFIDLDQFAIMLGVMAPCVAGNWYCSVRGFFNPGAGSALAANQIRLHPFIIPRRTTINSLGVRMTTGGGSNIQLALYANNYTTMRPTGAALGSTASISTAGSAGLLSATLSGGDLVLQPGIYWGAVNADSATHVFQIIGNGQGYFGSIVGDATFANVNSAAATVGWHLQVASQTFGTWPDLTSATFTPQTGNNYALLWFKAG